MTKMTKMSVNKQALKFSMQQVKVPNHLVLFGSVLAHSIFISILEQTKIWLAQIHFYPNFHSISKCSYFVKYFGLFQNRYFYTKLIIFFFNNRHKYFNFEMDNSNNHFIVQMFLKCTQNTVQNALQILFGKTELWMYAFQNT